MLLWAANIQDRDGGRGLLRRSSRTVSVHRTHFRRRWIPGAGNGEEDCVSIHERPKDIDARSRAIVSSRHATSACGPNALQSVPGHWHFTLFWPIMDRAKRARCCKQSGKLYCHSGLCDKSDILPDDMGDSEKFLQIPDKRELDFGKPTRVGFRPPIPARRLRRRSTIFRQKGRLRQIQGSVGSKGRARSMVRFRGEPRKEH
jgi:hypothetical protein